MSKIYGTPPAPLPVHRPAPSIGHLAMPIAGVIGALLVAIGSIMPWASVTTAFGGMTVAGTDGDGKITLAAGAVLAAGAALAGWRRNLWLRIAQLNAGVAVLVLAIYELIHVSNGVSEASSEYALGSTGSGLYVLVIGALVTTAAAGVHVMQNLPARR